MITHYLTKSDFKVAQTCATKLYYRKLGYPTREDGDEYLAALADQDFVEASRAHNTAERARFVAALAAMGKLMDDPKTPALTKLRIIEEIFDRDPTGLLAKRTQPVTPAKQSCPVFDNEAIRKVKERAAEPLRTGNGEKTE